MTSNKIFDLEKRTVRFSREVIMFIKKIKRDLVTIPIINQLVKSATSIGANYFEANGANSKRDFGCKINICKKESRETKYWLQLIAETIPEHKEDCRKLWKEAQELTLIFSKIIVSLRKNNSDKRTRVN